jgi:RNA recognition motif-containing protein
MTRIYVKGLPFSADWKEIKDAIRVAVISSYRQDDQAVESFVIGRIEIAKNELGKSIGIATVELSTMDAASRAIRVLNGTKYNFRPLKVEIHNSDKPLNPPKLPRTFKC